MATPIVIDAVWQDLKSGKTAPFSSAPVVLNKLLTILVNGDRSRIAAVEMTIRDATDSVVIHKLDTNYPWRVAPDSQGLSLPPGGYTFRAVPLGDDRKTMLASPLVVGFTVAAGTRSESPVSDSGDVAESPASPANGCLTGVVGALALWPHTPVTSSLWNGTKTFLEVARILGFDGVREWWSFTGNLSHDVTRSPKWDKLRPLVASGMRIVMCFAAGASTWRRVGHEKPAGRQAAHSMAACIAMIPPDLRPAIEAQVGNEMFFGEYWPGHDIKEFVDIMLGPCSAALRAAGIRVILGGLNGGRPAGDLQKVIGAGGGGMYDAVGYHPYAENVSAYAARTASLVAVTGAMPIVETESNTKDGPRYLAARAAGSTEAARCLAGVVANQKAVDAERLRFPTIEAAYQFSLQYQEVTMTGPLGLLDISYDGNNVAKSARTTKLFDAKYAARFANR